MDAGWHLGRARPEGRTRRCCRQPGCGAHGPEGGSDVSNQSSGLLSPGASDSVPSGPREADSPRGLQGCALLCRAGIRQLGQRGGAPIPEVGDGEMRVAGGWVTC